MRNKKLEAKKKEMKKDLDENWFDVQLLVAGEGKEPEKHYGGKVKLTRIWDDDKTK